MIKQECIEEMAKIMFEKAFENYETSGSVEIDTEVRRHSYSVFLAYCEALYNEGYRKVLLDTEDGKSIDCIQYAPWQLIEGYTEREVKRARKETAKEIFEHIVDGFLMRKENKYFFKKWLQERYDVEAEE